MHKFEFTDTEWREHVLSLTLAEWLKEWSLIQVDRTQDYYINRIKQLGLQGDRVLDAGCGMGNWSLALARWFNYVDALEIDKSKLEVLEKVAKHFNGSIIPAYGSIENLPYPDDTFDAIFCNGVIFLTDYRKSLREFYRVLRGEGFLYITYNGIEWWKHLLVNRGPNEPDCVVYGSNGIIHYLWTLIDLISLENQFDNKMRRDLLKTFYGNRGGGFSLLLHNNFDRIVHEFRKIDATNAIELSFSKLLLEQVFVVLRKLFIENSLIKIKINRISECINLLTSKSTVEYRHRLLVDLASRILLRQSDYEMEKDTWTFAPEEMSQQLTSLGFCNILSGQEGSLILSTPKKIVKPIYESWMGVYETFVQKPKHSIKLNSSYWNG